MPLELLCAECDNKIYTGFWEYHQPDSEAVFFCCSECAAEFIKAEIDGN